MNAATQLLLMIQKAKQQQVGEVATANAAEHAEQCSEQDFDQGIGQRVVSRRKAGAASGAHVLDLHRIRQGIRGNPVCVAMTVDTRRLTARATVRRAA